MSETKANIILTCVAILLGAKVGEWIARLIEAFTP